MSNDARYTLLRLSRIILGLTLMTFGGAGVAHAGCSTADVSPQSGAALKLAPSAYRPATGAGARLVLVQDEEAARPTIVGLWKFEVLAKSTPSNTNPMPDGTLLDFGTVAFHSDGTELTNSGSRNPADGNFCQGVWARVGPSSFAVNHYALAYMNGSYVGPANLKERLTLDSFGQQFRGVAVLVQYLAPMIPGHEFDETTPVVTITATVTATRINVD